MCAHLGLHGGVRSPLATGAVPPEQLEQMREVLERVGYRYYMEDDNALKGHYLNPS